MKKPLLLLFLCFCLAFSVAFGQVQPLEQVNPWGLKSIGFSATYGAEKFFEPFTFEYFNQNSGNTNSRYFELPPGGGTSQTRYLEDVTPLGLGLQLAWPVGKKHNEIRAGFAFQNHRNFISSGSRYNLSPDTIRLHSISLTDDYVISQASFDYVFYTKPILVKNLRFLWRFGSTFGVSTRHDYTHSETITDLDTADIYFSTFGNSYGYDPLKAKTYFQETSLSSSPRLEAGLRTSVGVELILNFFHQQIGLSAEYGHGLAGQKVLKGGTTDFKRTELGQLQARFFLR